jgi:hypothetical protein
MGGGNDRPSAVLRAQAVAIGRIIDQHQGRLSIVEKAQLLDLARMSTINAINLERLP